MADCTLNGLVAAAKCFDCLSQTEKKALKAFFLAQALKALGGADWTSTNKRRQQVASFNSLSDFRIESMDLVVAQRLAINAGAGAIVSLPVNALRAQINCTAGCGASFATFITEIMWLQCQLNKFIGTGAN